MEEKRVLIVDDDPIIIRALARIIEGQGFQVTSYLDPEEALASLGQRPVHLIISDYMMPGMNGVEFLVRARRLCPDAPRLLLTALSDFRVAMDAVNNGGIYRLLSKPWTQVELVGTVKQAFEYGELRRQNSKLNQLVQEQNGELQEINRDLERLVQERTNNLLEGITAALDYRDTETQWHSRRVSMYAKRLAAELGLTGQALFDVEVGALLHDVGKIGVRDSVLLKPGPLNPAEWQEMRQHPAIGYRLLRRIDYLQGAAKIVLQHQERWDGQGYPACRSGEEIVLGARIFAVVDAFDAICSDRPYRRGRSYEVALAEIRRCAGTQFDPAIVEAFARVPASDWSAIRDEVERLAAADRLADREDGLGDLRAAAKPHPVPAVGDPNALALVVDEERRAHELLERIAVPPIAQAQVGGA